MTLDDFLEVGEIRRHSVQYRKKWDEAVNVAAQQLMEHNAPYVAVSGGKDSGVLAYVVAEAAKRTGKKVRIWSHLSDASFPGTKETVLRIAEATGMEADLDICPFSAFDMLEAKQKRAFGKRGVFFDSIRRYAKDKDLSFVGVRASESIRRTRAAKVHGPVFYSKDMGDVTVCHPLVWFRLEDIAAATVEHNIPLHPIYSKSCIEPGKNRRGEDHFIRLGYITSKDLLSKGTTVFIKLNYPDIFEKLAQCWPEIRNDL